MFDGMPDQFLAATSRTTNTTTSTTTNTTTSSLPLSFSLHHANFPSPSFDASYILHNPQFPLHLQQQSTSRNEAKVDNVANSRLPISLLPEGSERPSVILPECFVPWSSEEVLSLLKIISSLDNPWFPPEFTWENVSRKMAEVGFKRSPDKCKEKFEEETRSFNNNSNKHNIISQNYRLFGELEELYNNTHNTNGDDYDQEQEQEQNPSSNQLDDQCNEPVSSLSRKNQSPLKNNDGDEVEEEVEKMGQKNSGNDETGAQDDNISMEEEDDDDSEKTEENTKKVVKKRKRQKKFEMFKGFCEKIVNKMIAQQEELHCKILQDMIKRDQEKSAREEAWRKEEIDRINQVIQVRAHEQAIVGDRQAKILGFLKKFSSSNNVENHSLGEILGNVMNKVPNTNSLSNSSILSQDSTQLTSSCATTHDQDSISNLSTLHKTNLPISLSKDNNLAPQSPNRLETPKLALPLSPSSLHQTSKSPNPMSSRQSGLLKVASDHTDANATSQVMDFKSPETHIDSKFSVGDVKDDTGRRWPRDEVLALINIRCSLFNNNGDHIDKENFSKGPLWERISVKMTELGYKRSAKRCKEKWENINKYFRKTKDLNKKRSIDSRTCPYFHQLSHLYNQGPNGQPGHPSNNLVDLPENQSMAPSDAQGGFNTGTTTMLGSQGNEGTVVRVSTGFGF